MARPLKDGLLYFPFDTGFFSDRSIRALKARFGADGISLYIYILCMVYGEKGYYAALDEDTYDQILDDTGISENAARQILEYLCKRSMLDSTLFTSVKILTSASIQEVYQEAKKGLKREVPVDEKYWLLEPENTAPFIKVTQNKNKSGKNPDKSEKNPSKSGKNDTNKRKENKRKIKEEEAVRLLQLYQQNIELPTPVIVEKIEDWLKDVDASLIAYAIEEAAMHNKRSFRYINAVINSHFASGRRTRAEAENAAGSRKSVKPSKINNFSYQPSDFNSVEQAALKKLLGKAGADE